MDGRDTQRLFVALPCPCTPPIASRLAELAQCEPNAGLRLVNPDTLHITLKFLGAVPPALIAGIRRALDDALSDAQGFTLELKGAGSFHSALWLGVVPNPAVDALARRCDTALQALGFAAEDKPFRPHMTLARLRRNAAFDCRSWARGLGGSSWGTLEARAVHLYRSETQPGGARYSVIHTTPLG